jgi:carbamoyl-phosphate synthase large subunit
MWFLKQYEELYTLEKKFQTIKVETLPRELLLEGNETKGFADRQIAHMMGCLRSHTYVAELQ